MFTDPPVYHWYLSVTAIFLNTSWSLHNVIAWMKNKPFLSKKASLFYIITVALVQPYWVLEIVANVSLSWHSTVIAPPPSNIYSGYTSGTGQTFLYILDHTKLSSEIRGGYSRHAAFSGTSGQDTISVTWSSSRFRRDSACSLAQCFCQSASFCSISLP